jgi:hypothetical protein
MPAPFEASAAPTPPTATTPSVEPSKVLEPSFCLGARAGRAQLFVGRAIPCGRDPPCCRVGSHCGRAAALPRPALQAT